MTCGGCGGGVLSSPITSGDLNVAPPEVDAESATYKVLVPTDGQGLVEHYYADYRDARIAWMRAPEGAKLRKI
jgi:hypothetical protein